MRRRYLAATVLVLVLGVTTCSPGNRETTAVPITTVSQAETEKTAETEDDTELEYFYGPVGEVADKVATAKGNEGKEVESNISKTKVEGADAIGKGDEVEVTYAGELSADITRVKSVNIVTSAAAEAVKEAVVEEDDIAIGIVEEANNNTLTPTTDKGTYTFNTKIVQKVSKDGTKSGVQADVIYYGDLEDEINKSVVIKIVIEDAMDPKDVKINILSDKVAEVRVDYVVIDMVDPESTLLTFLGKEGVSGKLKVRDTVVVIYERTLINETIAATGVK